MQKIIPLSIIVSIALMAGMLYFLSDGSNSTPIDVVSEQQNTEILDGVQYVTVKAKGGYSPRISEVKAGIPTKLIVKTSDTYDCSLALVVRSVGFQKMLQRTGEEIIDLGILSPGEKVQGVCGMGMYSFQVRAS